MPSKLSVVIPVYNEERRIPQNIDAIFSFLTNFPLQIEVLFVNDGSRDRTERILQDYQKNYDFRVVSYTPNRGKGSAVREGALAAEGDWIAFFDIDLATPLDELHKLLPFVRGDENAAVILGSRHMKGAAITKHESLLRVFLGTGYRLLSRLFVPSVTDFTCGFKCYRKDAARRIFEVARINRWAFDTEVIFLASHFGYSITQIPVQWAHDSDSRVRVMKAVSSSLKELGLIVWYSLTGAYRRSHDSGHTPIQVSR